MFVIEQNGFTPFSFLLPEEYCPPKWAEILFLMPCSKIKPYSLSKTHKTIDSTIGIYKNIHKVTLSGLYGPVPIEFEENNKAINSYDYLLTPDAYRQISLVTSRLALFIFKNIKFYNEICAYATVEPYRSIIEAAFLTCGKGTIFPKKIKNYTLEEFWAPENLAELKNFIQKKL
jgi:predicted RNA-binding protein